MLRDAARASLRGLAPLARAARELARHGIAAHAQPSRLLSPSAAAHPRICARWEPFAREPPLVTTQGVELVSVAPRQAGQCVVSSLAEAPMFGITFSPLAWAVHPTLAPSLELSSTKKKRKLKMNRHKVKKRRRKDRFKNKV
ncbi:hypothetical protein KFE25_006590 [Diacronema lutheri]|uniref:Ribosomal protein mS38 C-terminal domain-containing protein n=1 Tax=Diacronema lutheri TaxID=2081491 RepID=A0A8J5X9K4_DIALT|nr:hypothetical protein KFE25_006590 [Diacronema lutheri]